MPSPTQTALSSPSFEVESTAASLSFDVEKVFHFVLDGCGFLESHKMYNASHQPYFDVQIPRIEDVEVSFTEREATAGESLLSLVADYSLSHDEGMLYYEHAFRDKFEILFHSPQASFEMTRDLKRQTLLGFFRARVQNALNDAFEGLEEGVGGSDNENPFLVTETTFGSRLHDAVVYCVLYATGLFGGLSRASYTFPHQPPDFPELYPHDLFVEVLDILMSEFEETGIADWMREAGERTNLFGKSGGKIEGVDTLYLHLHY